MAGHFYMAILVRGKFPKSSHCKPLQPTLTWQFYSGVVYSSKVLPLQPISAHSYMANFFRGNSSKVIPLQPTAAHSYMAILVGGGGVILQKSSHCSWLQATFTWQFYSGGKNSSKVLPLQPISAHSYMANFFWDNSSKVVPLQPIAAHSYMAILVGGEGLIPQKSRLCSPLLHGYYTWKLWG